MLFSVRWLFVTTLVILTVLSLSGDVQCYNILAIFPHMGLSHWLFFRPFVSELVHRGHNVTLLSYFGIENDNAATSDDEMRTTENYHEYLFKRDSILTNTFDLEKHTPSFYRALLTSIRHLSQWGNNACDLLLNNERTDEILERGEKFDLVLTELFHTDCATGLAYRLNNIPVVGLSSCVLMPYFYQRFGMPDSPSYIPSEFVGFSEKMPLHERVANYLITKSMQILFDIYQTQPDNEMLRKKFGPDFPDIRKLVKNMSLVMVNTHYAIGGGRPSPPNVLDMAGVHVMGMQNKEMDGDLQRLLDRSTKGVLLMSFGSIIRLSTLPLEKRKMLMRVFGRLEQTVLMKWENSSAPVEHKPANVHFLSWLPQREILAHPNLKVFFSHGGMMGALEALTTKVPILGTPIYGDQYLNVATIDNRKAGVLLNYADWTEESIFAAVQKCLSKEYQDNAAMIATYLSQRNPLELGTNAIENVIATKGFHWARPYSVHLSWISLHSIDAILILLSPILISLAVVLFKKRTDKNLKVKRE